MSACKDVWSAAAVAPDPRGACYGATWENLIFHLWFPSMVWVALILLSYPAKYLYTYIVEPKSIQNFKFPHRMATYRLVGTEFEIPSSDFGYAFLNTIYVVQLVTSTFETYVAMAQTYAHMSYADDSALHESYELASITFYMIAFCLGALKHEFATHFFCSGAALIDIFTVSPNLAWFVMGKPALGDAYGNLQPQWLGLKFLRINRAMFSFFNLIQTGVLDKRFSEFTVQSMNMALKTACLSITMAGIIMLLEVLGEPSFMTGMGSIPTSMGQLSFIQMFYWIFTTISTVGYGDFSPSTNLSQACTILFIVIGVVFFSAETAKLLTLGQLLAAGQGRYSAVSSTNGGEGHVVLCGGGASHFSPSVKCFLKEIFTSGANFDVVVLTSEDIHEGYRAAMSESWTQGRLFVYHGSALNDDDLLRVRIYAAKMAFVMADGTSSDPDQEDMNNILRAANIHRLHPELRLRLMVLRPASKLTALSMGLDANMCYSLNEIKACLMAMSCRCPGYATLLMNLCIADLYSDRLQSSPDEYAALEPWEQQYYSSINKCIIGIILDEEYTGLPFGDSAASVYKATSGKVLLLAAQIQGKVKIYPANHILETDAVVFLLADDHDAAAQISKPLDPQAREKGPLLVWEQVADYTGSFLANQRDFSDNDAERLSKDLVLEEQLAGPQRERKRSGNLRETRTLLNTLANTFSEAGTSSQPTTAEGSADETYSDQMAAEERLTSNFSQEMALSRNDRWERMKEEALEAADFVQKGGHILLLLCQDGLWQQTTSFIRALRAPEMHCWRNIRNILVMCPTFPPSEMWDSFEDTAFVVGSPTKREDILRCGPLNADKICFIGGAPGDKEPRFADSHTMLAASMLESIFYDAKHDRYTIFEFVYQQNVKILPRLPVCCQEEGWVAPTESILHLEDDEKSGVSQPRFAAGRTFTPALVGAVFAQALMTPGVMEVVESLAMPSRRGQAIFPVLIPALEWVATEWIGRTYGDLAEGLLASGLAVEGGHRVLPLGLYRRGIDLTAKKVQGKKANPREPNAPHQGLPFVFANPGRDQVLLPGDQIYVLAPQGWAGGVMDRADAILSAMKAPSPNIFEELSGVNGLKHGVEGRGTCAIWS